MNALEVLRARSVLQRLQRGVPPVEGLEELSLGMEPLIHRLDKLLQEKPPFRWLAVQSEYGEGKSHFHAVARQLALRQGYAVASLDVNKDEGALHQPQRHLAVILDSLRSPLPALSAEQGLASLFHTWIERTPCDDALELLGRCRVVTPSLPGRDLDKYCYWLNVLKQFCATKPERLPLLPGFVAYLTAQDLISKATYARSAAYHRLQIVAAWLLATGHRGLLLFIDEVDNVVRQIHSKAHAGCFRTLAWYCSAEELPALRTVVAATPEVLTLLGSRGPHYQSDLAGQITVWPHEAKVFDAWHGETRRLARQGWPTCPRLDTAQRVELFRRIACIHQIAWNSTIQPSANVVVHLANQPQFRVSRRWVRAAVQLLDLLNPPDVIASNGSV